MSKPLRMIGLLLVFLFILEAASPLLAGGVSFRVSVRVGGVRISERGRLSGARLRAHHTFYAGGFKGFRSVSSSSLGEALVGRSLGWGYSAGNTLNLTGVFDYSERFSSSFGALNCNSSLKGEGGLYSEVNGSLGPASARLGVAVEGNLSAEQLLILGGSAEAVESLEAYGKRIRAWAGARDEVVSTSYELTVEDLGWPTPESASGSLSSEAGASSLVSSSLSAGGDVVKASSFSASPTGNYSASSEAYNATLSLKAEVASSKREAGTSWSYYGYGRIPTINETFHGPGVNLTNYLAGEGYPYNVSGSVSYAGGLAFSQSLSNLAGKVEAWRLTRGSYEAYSYLNCTGDVYEEVSILASAVTYKESRDVNASGEIGALEEQLSKGDDVVALSAYALNGYIVTNLNASMYSSLNISSTLNGSGIGRATNKLREKWWIRWPPIIAIPGFKVYLSSRGKGESNFTVEIYGGSLKGVFRASTNEGWRIGADANLVIHTGPKVIESLSWREQVSTSEYFYPGLIIESMGVINDEVSRLELSAYNSRLKFSAGISGGESVEYNLSLSGDIGKGTLVNYTEYYGGEIYTDHWQMSGLILGDVMYKLPWPWPGVTLLPSGIFMIIPPNMSSELYLGVSEGHVNYLARGSLGKVWRHSSFLEVNAQDVGLRIGAINVTIYPYVANFTDVSISMSNGSLSLNEGTEIGGGLISNVDLRGRGKLKYCSIYTNRLEVEAQSYRGQFHASLNVGHKAGEAFIRIKGADLLGYFGLGIGNFKFINNSSAFTSLESWKDVLEELKQEVEGIVEVEYTPSYAHGYYNITDVGYGYASMNITNSGYSFKAEGWRCQYWASMTLRDEHWKEVRLDISVGGTPYLEGSSNFDLIKGIHTLNISGHCFYMDIDTSRHIYRGYGWGEWYSTWMTGYSLNRTKVTTLITPNKLYANYSADGSIYGYSLTDVSDNSYRFNLSSGDVNYYLGRPYGWLSLNANGKRLEGLLNITSSNHNDQVYSQWDSIGGSAYVNLGSYGFSTGLRYYYGSENAHTATYVGMSPDVFSASLNATGIGCSYAITSITGRSYLYILEARQEAFVETWWLGSLYINNGLLGGYINLTGGVHRFFTHAENIDFNAPFGDLRLTDGYLRGTFKAHNVTYNLAFDGEGRYWFIGLLISKVKEQNRSRAYLWGDINNGKLTGYIGSSPGRLVFNLSSHHKGAFIDLECRQEIIHTEPSAINFLYNIPGFFYTSPNPYVDVSLSSFTGDISSSWCAVIGDNRFYAGLDVKATGNATSTFRTLMDDLGYAYVEYGSSGSEPEMMGHGYSLATFSPTMPGLSTIANFTLRGDSLRVYAQALEYGQFFYRQYPLEGEPPYEWTGGFAEFLAKGSGKLRAYVNASVAYEYLYYHLFDPEIGLYWEVGHEIVPDVIAETNLAKKAIILEPYYWWAIRWVAWAANYSVPDMSETVMQYLADAGYAVYHYADSAATINKYMHLNEYHVVLAIGHMEDWVIDVSDYGYVTYKDLSSWYINPPPNAFVVLCGCESMLETPSPLAEALGKAYLIGGFNYSVFVIWAHEYMKQLFYLICKKGWTVGEANDWILNVYKPQWIAEQGIPEEWGIYVASLALWPEDHKGLTLDPHTLPI